MTFRDYEEYQFEESKEYRKERKRLSQKDRSKYKKSDQNKQKTPIANEKILKGPLLRGRVLSILPEGIQVSSNHHLFVCSLKGVLKKDTSRIKNLIAVGDFVQFTLQDDQSPTIVSIEERTSILSREMPLMPLKQQLIAVNIDQVFITASVLFPPLKPHLIDRYIIAAQKGNMQPVIVINKIDLLNQPSQKTNSDEIEKEKNLLATLIKTYSDIHIPVYAVSSVTKEGIDAIKRQMRGKTSVFSGQSGTGKSSLINAITGKDLEIGSVVSKTKKGSHTTSKAELLSIEDEGFCIDTPGIKSFGIWNLKKEELQKYFSEIVYFASQCKFLDCTHLKEPECAVKKAVLENKISPLRFESYCALIKSITTEHRLR